MLATARKLGPGRLEKGLDYAGKQPVWIARWTDAQGRRRKRILSSDRRVAERAFVAIIRNRDLDALGLGEEGNQARGLGEVRDAYLADLETRVKPAQVKRIRGVLAKMLDHLGPIRVMDLTKAQVLAWRQQRVREGLANRTVNLEVNALRSVLKWATDNGLIGKNPLANLKPLPAGKAHEKRPRRALSREEIDRLHDAADRIDERRRARWAAEKSIASGGRGVAFRDRKRKPHVPQAPLWRAMVWTGARWGELTAARWADVDLGARTLRLRAETTKSRKVRVIPLVDIVVEDLIAVREIHRALLGRDPGPADHVFLGPRGKPVGRAYRRCLYRFRELLREAGIPDSDEMDLHVDQHAMRYTCATSMARAGVPLTIAQRFLGHSDPKLTTAIYTDLRAEDLRVAAEMMQASSR